MALTYDDYYNKQLKLITPQMNTAISESNSTYDSQKTAVRDNYNYQISEAEKSYGDSHRENAIQKLINERQVAESMANMGLDDSGLNRTQQTAVQLSYANNKSSIDRQKQAQVDALAQQLSATLSEIDINRSNAATSIKNTYYNQAAQNAASLYNADVEAETEMYKAALAAQSNEDDNLLYTFTGRQEKNDSGETVKVFTDNSGKEKSVKAGYNPYTGDNNLKTYAAEAKDKNIGFFSNSYQPRGLVSEGGKFNAVTLGGQVVQYNYKGKWQNLWCSPKGNYFLWDGSANQYIQLSNENAEQIIDAYTGQSNNSNLLSRQLSQVKQNFLQAFKK